MKRKEKLRLEHDRLFDRAWVGYKPSTSTFLTNCHPQYKLTSREKNRKKKLCVYFVHFRSKQNPTYSFFKIGISDQHGFRFDFDSHRYNYEFLKVHNVSTRTQALRLEKHLHTKFAEYSHVPSPALLSGGNSECFIFDKDLKSKILEAFTDLNKFWMGTEEMVKIKEEKLKRGAMFSNAILCFGS
jgi:hypothetical protein